MKVRTILLAVGIATSGLLASEAFTPSIAATTTEVSFFGETDFGFGDCSLYNSSVCSLNGQGFLSGILRYEASNTPINQNTQISLEFSYNGLINSFGLLENSPKNVTLEFATDSVTVFPLQGELGNSFYSVETSFSDPALPEFSIIDIHIQGSESQHPFPNLFMFSTPLESGGSRILSEGSLTFTSKSVPEPSTILGLFAVLGIGVSLTKSRSTECLGTDSD